MARLDPIPQARVVRKGGQLMTPPRAPRTKASVPIAEHARNALAMAIGLWPLTAVVLLMIGFLIMGGRALEPR